MRGKQRRRINNKPFTRTLYSCELRQLSTISRYACLIMIFDNPSWILVKYRLHDFYISHVYCIQRIGQVIYYSFVSCVTWLCCAGYSTTSSQLKTLIMSKSIQIFIMCALPGYTSIFARNRRIHLTCATSIDLKANFH